MVNPITLEKVVGCTTAVSRLKEPAQEVISYTPFPFRLRLQFRLLLVLSVLDFLSMGQDISIDGIVKLSQIGLRQGVEPLS